MTSSVPTPILDFETQKPDWGDDDIAQYVTTQSEFDSLVMKAQKRAIEDKLTQYYKKMIDEELYQVFPTYAGGALRRVHDLKQQTDNIYDTKNGKHEYCFYTVNFKPEYDNKLDEVDKLLKEFANSQKYVKDNFCYTIEQRSEGDEPSGVHCHILFKKGDFSPSKISRAFKNKFFDKYVGTPASLDYRYTNDYLEKLRYILGLKKSEKMRKVYADRRIRVTHGLLHYYNNGFDQEIEEIIKSKEYENLFSHII